jgi:16S rRNA (uracil1498-N3)-methyltransferase
MRFFLPPDDWTLGAMEVVLDEAESRHAAAVLRVRLGDGVEIFDGAGRAASAVVTEVARNRVRLRVGAVGHTAPPAARLVLAVAVPKGSTIEWIIEKAVELGASEIIPLLTRRTVIRLNAAEGGERRRKWEKVAIEACKQCGRNWLPRVWAPGALSEALAAVPPGAFVWPLVASLQPDARPLGDLLREGPADGGADAIRPADAAVWIGPEGDFTGDEYDQLRAAGLQPVTLGPLVLRVETAALFCLSVLRHRQENPG